MIFLHCYHYFRLGGLRKSTEKNCKMDVIEICFVQQKCFMELSCRGVTYQY